MGIDRKDVRSNAQKQVRKGNWSRAIDEYEKLVDDDPDDVRSRLKLADLYTRVGEEQKAVDSYREVGDRHADDDLYQKALAVYKQAIRLDDDPALHRKVGEAYHRLDRLKDAAQALRRAQERYKAAGMREQQLEVLEELVRLDSEDVGLHIQLAETYAKQDRDDEALERFRRAADMLEEEGRVDDYTQVAERIVYFDPEDMEVRKRATRIYCDRNDHKRALKHLQVLFSHNPEDEEILRQLAETFMALERNEKATLVFQKLAAYYEGEGRTDSARQTWTRILDIDPTNEAAQQALQRLGDEPAPEASGRRSRESADVPAIADDEQADDSGDALEDVEFLDEGPETPEPQRGVEPEAEPTSTDAGPADHPTEPVDRSTNETRADHSDSGAIEETAPTGHDPPESELRDVSDQLEPIEPDEDGTGLDPEVGEMLDEVDVFIKYELYDKARDLIADILERAPNLVEAYEKRRNLYAAMDNVRAEAETLVEMARLCSDRPEQARSYLEEASDLGAGAERVDAAARELGIDLGPPTPEPAPQSPASPADGPETPPPPDPPTERHEPPASEDGGIPVEDDDVAFVEVTTDGPEAGSDEFDDIETSEVSGGFVEETEVLEDDDSFGSDEELEAVGDLGQTGGGEDFQEIPATDPNRQPVDHAETEINEADEISFSDEDLEGAFDNLFKGVDRDEEQTSGDRLDEIDALIEAGRMEEAEAALRTFEQRHPDHPGVEDRYRRIEGSDANRRNFDQPPTGARSLSGEFEAIRADDQPDGSDDQDVPETDVMHSSLELGISYRDMEMYDEAIREFRQAIQDPEAAPAAKFHIAVCRAEKGDTEEAAQDLTRLLRHDHLPDNLREAARDKLEELR